MCILVCILVKETAVSCLLSWNVNTTGVKQYRSRSINNVINKSRDMEMIKNTWHRNQHEQDFFFTPWLGKLEGRLKFQLKHRKLDIQFHRRKTSRLFVIIVMCKRVRPFPRIDFVVNEDIDEESSWEASSRRSDRQGSSCISSSITVIHLLLDFSSHFFFRDNHWKW